MSDTPGYVKNLKKESVVQSVINCLTDAMRNKQLKPGDRIPPEPELAASMGVARSSVREAIKILTYLGVLESKRSEGTFVCSGFQESMIALRIIIMRDIRVRIHIVKAKRDLLVDIKICCGQSGLTSICI